MSSGEAQMRAVLDRVVTEVAGVPLGPDTGFFEAGLTSAVVLRIHAVLQTELGRDIPILMLFKYPNPRALSRWLASEPAGPAARSSAAAGAPASVPAGSPAQARRALRKQIRGAGR
jgi:mycobactin peptide synthetase MbtE